MIRDAANADLDEIIGYIVIALANPQAAASLADKIARAMMICRAHHICTVSV